MNSNISETVARPFYLKRTIWGLIAAWTFFTIMILIGLMYFESETTKEMALIEARAAFNKDMEYFHWISNQRGVYALLSGSVKQNSSLKNLAGSQLKINDSLNLVLLKPSCMLQLTADSGSNSANGLRTKLISLNPVKKENVPTSAEKAALEILKSGKNESISFTKENGEAHLLFVGKLLAERSCLKCHTNYVTGNMQGGISVHIPLTPIVSVINKRINIGALGIGLLWIIGIVVIYLGGERLNKQVRQNNNVLIRLNQSRNMLLEAQRITDLGSFEWDLKTNKTLGSENFYKIFGRIPGAEIGTVEDFLKILLPEDLEYTRARMQELIDEHKRVTWDFRAVKPNKTIVFLQAWGYVYLNDLNEPVKVIVSIQDITERRKSEFEIKKLSRAVEQSPATVVITDTMGNIVYVNSKFIEVTGYSFEEAIGKNPRILKSGLYTKEDYEILWNTILSGKEWRGEFHNKKKNGELFWESASISSIKNRFGEMTNFIAIKEDITKKKEMEFELNKALEREAESSRLKSTLLANMSHELRTPMNGIIGFSQLLEEEINDSGQKQMLHSIQESSRRLMTTLNTILDLSELESDKSSLKFENIQVSDEIEYVLEQYKNKISLKNLSLEYYCPDEFYVFADVTILQKILLNLIDNAVKFTFKGGITISAEKFTKEENVFIKINVTDTGIGIDKNNLELIFKEFRQASEGYNRSFEGSGLGLTLGRKMANLIGGDIFVKSKIGEGSVFSLILPVGNADDVDAKKERKLHYKEIKSRELRADNMNPPAILLVEDNEVNKDVVQLYLTGEYALDFAPDGEEAVKMAEKKKYDLILMDINLGSGMNGVEATREIRKFPGYETVPIVALTGYAMRKDKENFLAEGMTHYLAKPFDQEEISGLLKEIFGS